MKIKVKRKNIGFIRLFVIIALAIVTMDLASQELSEEMKRDTVFFTYDDSSFVKSYYFDDQLVKREFYYASGDLKEIEFVFCTKYIEIIDTSQSITTWQGLMYPFYSEVLIFTLNGEIQSRGNKYTFIDEYSNKRYLKDGIWVYYNSYGKVDLVQFWEQGKLIQSLEINWYYRHICGNASNELAE